VGVLDMQTESVTGTPAENFAVARVRRTVLGGIDLGGIVVNREATDGSDTYNRSWGVDASTRVFDNLILSSYLAGTGASDGPSEGNTAWRVNAGWRDPLWDVSVMHKRVGESFAPGVGYVRRRAMQHSYATVGAHPRPALPFVQQVNPYAEVEYITDPSGVLETRTGTLGFGINFLDGGQLTSTVRDQFERLHESFAISGGGRVPAGDHAFREGMVRYQSSQSRALSGNVSYTGGGYFNGERGSLGGGAAWRPSYRLLFELRADHNQIRLPDGEYTADVFGGRLRYAYSTRLFGSAFVQYNQALEQVVTNLRLNLIHAPLSDFFLVFTERRPLHGPGVAERLLSAKITRMVSF